MEARILKRETYYIGSKYNTHTTYYDATAIWSDFTFIDEILDTLSSFGGFGLHFSKFR